MNLRTVDIYMTDFLQLLIDSGELIHSVKVNSGWIEIDSQEDLEAYQALIQSGDYSIYDPGA